MIDFEIAGSVDPILKARLHPGDELFCESGAMVSMDECLSLTGKARGGVLSAIGRKMLNDESFFQQKIEAGSQGGEVLLSPQLAGDVRLLDVGSAQFTVADGCYLANTAAVRLELATQGIGKALFAKSGGFFTMKTSGQGTLAVSGFGSIHELEVRPDHPILVDNGHLVAWDSALKYEVALNTAHKGLFGSMVQSVVSGAMVVLRFSGNGRVLVSSRSREDFSKWLGQSLATLNTKP
jgi:uncharacterized protein (TIGR00266 family)